MRRIMSVVDGCTYDVVHRGGKRMRLRVKHWDPVDRVHVVTFKGRDFRVNFNTLKSYKRSRCVGKTCTREVYLYLCNIGGGFYKLGASSDPERRRKQIRTYSRKAKLHGVARIPEDRGREFRSYEKNVLSKFANPQGSPGGTEVLRLRPEEADSCLQYMRMICKYQTV